MDERGRHIGDLIGAAMEEGKEDLDRAKRESAQGYENLVGDDAARRAMDVKWIQEEGARKREAEKATERAYSATGDEWHAEGDSEDLKAELDRAESAEPEVEIPIDVDEEALRDVRYERGRGDIKSEFSAVRKKAAAGEVDLDDAANELLGKMADLVAGERGEGDEKRVQNLIHQTRGMMKMHLRGDSGMSDEAALSQVESFMTKLWGGKERVVPGQERAHSPESQVTGMISEAVVNLRQLEESKRGPEIKRMLESVARELLGDSADDKKVTALAQSYDGLMRTFLRIDQLPPDEVAAQLSRQMVKKAADFRGNKAA